MKKIISSIVVIFIISFFVYQYNGNVYTNKYVNVSEVALIFGGGGHSKAAGCTAENLTPEEIKEKLVQEIKHQL